MSNTSPGTPRKIQLLRLVGLLALAAVAALAFGAQWASATDGETPNPNYTWEGDRRLSSTSSAAFGPDLQVAGNGDLMIAYDHRIDSNTRNPYYRRSTNDGATWSAPAPIHNSNDDLRQVTVAFDGNNRAHAAWRSDNGLFHAAQNQWPTGSNTVHATAADTLDPVLTIAADNVLHLVWAQGAVGSPHNIYHSYSQNGGSSWSSPVALATTAQHSSYPNLTTDNSGNVHVVWEERILDPQQGSFRYEIHYKKGTKTTGYSWSASPTAVSGTAEKARRPSLVARGQTIHLTYAIQESNEEQYPYYRRSTNGGASWSTPRDVSNNTPVSVNTNSPFYLLATIQVCAGDVFIYYHGATELNAREQIWGATSANNWSELDVVTSNSTRNIDPRLVCVGGNLHLGYERIEQADVNHQIYYNQSNNVNQQFLPLLSRG